MNNKDKMKKDNFVPINPMDLLFFFFAIMVVWLGVGVAAVYWIGGNIGTGFLIVSILVVYYKFYQCQEFLKKQASYLDKGGR